MYIFFITQWFLCENIAHLCNVSGLDTLRPISTTMYQTTSINRLLSMCPELSGTSPNFGDVPGPGHMCPELSGTSPNEYIYFGEGARFFLSYIFFDR